MRPGRICAVAAAALLSTAADAAIVWTGPKITFTKPNFADWTLPENQDRITDNVWITRKDMEGIFNIQVEESYLQDFSPADTEWATGSAADYANLTFEPWAIWHGHFPPGTIGVDAVLHLITDDIYIDITFLTWTAIMGGGFSYERSTPIPAPSGLVLLAAGALAGSRRRRN